jgi:hypothetical protein
MAEHRRKRPLLVYRALAAIASARRKETGRTPDSEGYETVRKPYRAIYPAPDENSDETCPTPQVDLDKRPKEQVENDQPISAQLRRAKEQGGDATPWLRGKFRGQGGKISFGASMRA